MLQILVQLIISLSNSKQKTMAYIDTGIFNQFTPQCILRCDPRYMLETNLSQFPLHIQLNRGTMTKHCRSHSVSQIVCP